MPPMHFQIPFMVHASASYFQILCLLAITYAAIKRGLSAGTTGPLNAPLSCRLQDGLGTTSVHPVAATVAHLNCAPFLVSVAKLKVNLRIRATAILIGFRQELVYFS